LSVSTESYLIVVEASDPTQRDFHQLGADFENGRDGQTLLELCRCEALIGSMRVWRSFANDVPLFEIAYVTLGWNG
jgi:hypothetical protein